MHCYNTVLLNIVVFCNSHWNTDNGCYDNTKQYYFNQKDNYNQRHFYTYNIFDKTILNNPLHFNGFNYNNMNTMFKNQNKNYTSQSDNDNINSSSNQCLYPNAV